MSKAIILGIIYQEYSHYKFFKKNTSSAESEYATQNTDTLQTEWLAYSLAQGQEKNEGTPFCQCRNYMHCFETSTLRDAALSQCNH